MEYQSFGRPQRPKGANIKQALKVILVLAVCAWLVYQIKDSVNKMENYGGQTKLLVGYGAVSLGRKGTPSGLNERAIPDSQDVDSAGEAKESSDGRDEVFDGAREDKAEEEFGHINGKFGTREGRKMEHEPETQPKVPSKHKYRDSSKEKSGKVLKKSRRESDHIEPLIEKYPNRPVVNDSQSNEKEIKVQLREQQNAVQIRKNAKSEFSTKENDDDKDPRVWEKEARTQESVVESSTNASAEGIDEVLSFHDENGVPPDGDEIKSVLGQAHIVHEENISKFSEGKKFQKSNIYEVTSGEADNVKVNLEGSKNDATTDEEFNSRAFTHIDTSGINNNSEIGEGDSQVL